MNRFACGVKIKDNYNSNKFRTQDEQFSVKLIKALSNKFIFELQ